MFTKKFWKVICCIALSVVMFGLGCFIENLIIQERDIADDEYTWYTPTENEKKESKVITPSKKEENSSSYNFQLSSGESKTVSDGNTEITVSYGIDTGLSVDYDDKTKLRKCNGCKVNSTGDFNVVIDGIKYEIRDIQLKCSKCGYHEMSSLLCDGLGLCKKCGRQFRYEDADISYSCGIMFCCPDCGKGTYTNSGDKCCPKCGRDLTEDIKRLKKVKWESR